MASSEFFLQGTRMASAKLSSATAPRAPWSIHLLLTLIVALVAAFARPALPNTPEDGSTVQRPRDAESGRLFFRGDDQRQIPAPLLHTDVRIAVSGMVARSVVKQQFHNAGAGWVEGVYVFPLPKDSAVDRLRLTIGERVITGTIEERQHAQRAYQQARAQGQRAGLVEQERPNIFTTSVANIGPDEKVTVEIEYQESSALRPGPLRPALPARGGPALHPGRGGARRRPRLGAGHDRGSRCASHHAAGAASVRRPDQSGDDPGRDRCRPQARRASKAARIRSATSEDANGRVTVALAEERVPADRDFVLSWRPEPGAAPTAGLFVEEREGRTHLLVMLMPPTAEAVPTVPPREMIFIIDTSGSMEGTSIRQAKAALHLGLDRLKPHDTFNIIQFNSTASVLFGGPQAATRDSLRMAHDYVESLRATGGTEMLPALNLALNGSEKPGRVRQLVFLTDGAVGNEDALFRRIQERLGDSRLFTIGIGSAPNSWFMSRAAQAGRGTFTHIDKLGEVTQRMAALFEKLEKPVLTDVVVEWPDGVDVETYPAPIPDLYAGEPVVFVGRAGAALPANAAIRISGRSAGQTWKRELSLAGREDRPGVAPVWARRKLAALEDSRLEGTSPTQVREDSLKLALAYQLISRYTSLVAVDPMPVRPQTAPVERSELPTNLPAGWSYEAVFGGPHAAAPAGSKHAYAPGTAVQRAMAPAPMLDQSMTTNAVTLPQTATAAELKIIFGLLSLLAAIVLLVWQYRTGRRRA